MAGRTSSSESKWQHPSSSSSSFLVSGEQEIMKEEEEEEEEGDDESYSESTLLWLIERSLQLQLLDNALWWAERCVAEYPSRLTSIYWLAHCHYLLRHYKAARHVLEKSGGNSRSNDSNNHHHHHHKTTTTDEEMKNNIDYLEALCCLEMKDYRRAEECLLRKARSTWKEQFNANNNKPPLTGNSLDEYILNHSLHNNNNNNHHHPATLLLPNGAAGFALLAKVFLQSNRKKRAIAFFKASLQMDPFLWTSYEALAQLGALDELDDEAMMTATTTTTAQPGGRSRTLKKFWARLPETATHHHKPPTTTTTTTTPTLFSRSLANPLPPLDVDVDHHSRNTAVPTRVMANTTTMQTPGLTPIPPSSASRIAPETPSFIIHRNNTNNNNNNMINNNPHHTGRHEFSHVMFPPQTPETTTDVLKLQPNDSTAMNPEADSSLIAYQKQALFFPSSSKVHTDKVLTTGKGGGGGGGTHREDLGENGTKATDIYKSENAVLRLVQTAATYYQHVCQYRCKEALVALRKLNKKQQVTGWVLHQQGRAHLELNEFAAAQRSLELMKSKDPCRLEGLELLSTVYWHLKKEVELSHLAQFVLAADRLSPITWCVVGNCFSLQKDHETALVFFRRSLQIDINFTYVHTLSGYEYMANEDFDKAIACFRQALRVNERHYNAWYGLGAIFHRQEKFDLAEYHFERAVQLHPMSSILLCNLGVAQYANGKAYQALDTLAQAFRLDPQNPQARFQRASIYAALHRPAEALAELLKVRDAAPREAAVHFAMGKVLKRLGRPQEAISSFLTAMDLDPKDNQIIKSAMDKVGEPDASEESMSTF